MSDLDIMILNFIYQKCLEFGRIFTFGAKEGLFMYLSILSLVFVRSFDKK